MSDYSLIPYAVPPATVPPDTCGELTRLAAIGAVVGGAVAAARSVERVRRGAMLPTAALSEVGRTAIASGVASGAAGAVAEAVTGEGPLRLGVLFVATAAALYGIDRYTRPLNPAAEQGHE